MAFVAPTVPSATAFTGSPVRACAARAPATVRCAADDEPRVFGKQGNSMWKESWFTGGMPGGEVFYLAWVEDGMRKDFPDMPARLQPAHRFEDAPPAEKGGVLGRVDATEFFADFAGSAPAAGGSAASGAAASGAAASGAAASGAAASGAAASGAAASGAAAGAAGGSAAGATSGAKAETPSVQQSGDTVVSLVPGSGGGLKLDFTVQE